MHAKLISECPFRGTNRFDSSGNKTDILQRLGLCTNTCKFRDVCIVERIPFLIYGNVFRIKKVIIGETIDDKIVNSIVFTNFISDAYINELTGAVD